MKKIDRVENFGVIEEIKKRAVVFVDDNFTNPNPMDYLVVGNAMLIGASVATSQNMSVKKETAALELIASKSTCECWYDGLWCGCQAHNSSDPEEWCLTCIAHEALKPTEISK